MNFKKVLKTIMVVAVMAGSILTANAGKISSNNGTVQGGYNYMFYAPTTEVETDFRTPIVKKPLVIFLHGSSLCGNNLERVKRYGTINAIEKGRELDAYVLAPQNPGGSWKPEKIMKIVDHLLAEHNDIDANRIYVLGMSLGGYGTIDLAATYPDRIAAAMALCGGGTVRNYAGLNKVPLWIIHGTADAAVSIRESDKVVNNMKQSSPDTPRLGLHPCSGHEPFATVPHVLSQRELRLAFQPQPQRQGPFNSADI